MHVCEEHEPTTFFAWSLLLIFILGFTCCWGRYLKPGMLGPTKGKLKPADKVVNGTLRNILRSDSLCSASSSYRPLHALCSIGTCICIKIVFTTVAWTHASMS